MDHPIGWRRLPSGSVAKFVTRLKLPHVPVDLKSKRYYASLEKFTHRLRAFFVSYGINFGCVHAHR